MPINSIGKGARSSNYQILFLAFFLAIWYNKSVNCRDFTIRFAGMQARKDVFFEEIYRNFSPCAHLVFRDTAERSGSSFGERFDKRHTVFGEH